MPVIVIGDRDNHNTRERALELQNAVKALIESDRIGFVYMLRAVNHIGLREAKNIMDNLQHDRALEDSDDYFA